MSTAFAEFIREQLSLLGPVTVRRMFGGHGIFLDGAMFALIADDTLYFKVDDASRPAYEAEGLEPFSYDAKSKKHVIMSYSRAPERVLDDPDEMLLWAKPAFAAARRAAAAKQPAKKRAARKKAATKPSQPPAGRRHSPTDKADG
jgi:DNA transformation protein